MNRLLLLLKHEIYIYHKVYTIPQYVFIHAITAILALSMITTPQNLSTFGTLLTLIVYILAILNLSVFGIKKDLEDGSLDNLLIVENAYHITVAKIIGLFTVVIIPFILTIPIIAILYNLTCDQIAKLLSSLLLFLQISSITTLTSIIQSYFYVNSYLISVIIIPLIIPGLIITGLIIEYSNNIENFLPILVGITLLFLSISVLLGEYLIKNIYNIQ
ncbi:ccmB family protein [Orientia tsutsugamushi str. UT76]|uniref:Heme exporter protein B n=1 Tax=Orientia tsutsugamushi TaxID=784 RepID=A0A2U3R2G0_ORITS|nr:heme exporter protein CcmB [Orientia tsutsugamushi]KJV89015.1 ccmB family protein [Orientia tsutsugamushi str. UT76]SPR07378.1 heme exporter protein B [Orientia tsutsugamushi]